MCTAIAADHGAMRSISLSDLPEEALIKIFRQLDARQLARVGVQDRRLRELSGDGALWRAHCSSRWPGCSAAHYGGDHARMYRARAALPSALVRAADRCHMLTVRASAGVVRLNSASLAPPGGVSPQNSGGGGGGNGGSSSSSSLEHSQNNNHNSSSSTSTLNNHESSSSSSVNNGSAARGAAASSSAPCSPAKPNVYGVAAAPYASTAGMLFDEVAQAALSVGLALAGGAGAGRSHNNHASGGGGGGAGAEVARFRADAAWWLSARPEVVVRFVRRSCDALQASSAGAWGNGGGGNGGAFASWPDVPWRRSALQVLLDLGLGPQAGVCPSVTERLQREADRLDAAIRGLRCSDACHLEVRRPAGVPRTHWWYFLSAAQGPQQMATAG